MFRQSRKHGHPMSKDVQRERKIRQEIREVGSQNRAKDRVREEMKPGRRGPRPRKRRDANRSEIAGAGRHTQPFSRM